MQVVSRQVGSRRPSEAGPARIAPLAVLPIFLDLCGKRAVVAGGSEAAAWKAELLAAAGARVRVYSAENSPAMRELARDGRIDLVCRAWRDADLAGAAVAVADAGDDDEAARFSAAARAAGAACNVVDRPEHCQFQFGAIVNRSPVVVGISTSGAAPVLAQAIRRRIETLLPPALADWAAFARAVRQTVGETLGPARRRDFWEALADRAFGPPPTANAMADLRASTPAGGDGGSGHVTFVGAGPGDAELLTLKAVRALQAADVILFDDLVSDAVLELARREARRILVGKRAGRPSCRQHEINDTMVRLARAGRRVVRLKSGDPMIFGRAGEEIEVLEREGIAYDVVPGITAGLAMAAALGVSLTHRDHAKSVRFVTGHSRHGGLPEDADWRAIADPSATTIFYMAARTAGEIAERLLGLGCAPETPVAIAASLGRPEQALRRATLRDLRGAVEDVGLSRPLIVGVGRAFGRLQTVETGKVAIARSA
jgi:uroporphyrin-III C-methyltransferase/precorrin-2 dehydrogenase/sirohydrochlorin ferrochelatase